MLSALLEVVGPDDCPSCGGPRGLGGSMVCSRCRPLLPARLRPFDPPNAVAWAFGLGPYEGPLGAMVRRAKYRPDAGACRELATRLAAAAEGRLPDVDAVVYVPVPARRRMRRGFDQAELLASQVARALGRPVLPALRRVRPGEQAGRSHRDRAAGARGAWRLCRPPPPRVLLVDDVVTTGATATACADELLCGGARRVGLLCVAAAVL
ncbi:MAG: ComF family protein [Deltaproteobacteria bacterium]|nr:MAG: ComF family protein [Deltaproteobacteria bacterium]